MAQARMALRRKKKLEAAREQKRLAAARLTKSSQASLVADLLVLDSKPTVEASVSMMPAVDDEQGTA